MARRRVTEGERAALRVWIEIAKTRPDEPLPEQATAAIREMAQLILKLTLSRAPNAAKVAACFAGLTGVAMADFQSQQDDLVATAVLEFNKHNEHRTPLDKVAYLADKTVSDLSASQVFRRRARALAKNRN